MPLDASRINAIVFDYGNTLIHFDSSHALRCDEAMIDLLERRCGPVDRGDFLALRNADRMAPYRDDYRESRLRDLFINHIRQLYNTEPTEELLDDMAALRFDSFIDIIEAPPDLHDVLTQLHDRYALAVLSNYPDGEAIRASMDKIGITGFFHSIVVSGDVGRVKPHPRNFQTVLGELGTRPDETLHVGDNWLADIQGGKRAGLSVCHFTKWETPERFDAEDGDAPPDLVIDELSALPQLLSQSEAAAANPK